MTPMDKSGIQHAKGSQNLTGRGHLPAPTERDQVLAIGFILALIVFVAVL